MKHLRLAAWTVWFMLCWVGIASAEPVSMLIAGIAGILKAGGIGAMLIKAAFGIALQVGATLLQKAMAKKQPQPGITGQLQVGGNNSVSFVVGHYATAGSLEYTGEWGNSGKTPNAYHVQVITLSDLPQPGIRNRVWINGQECTIDFDSPHPDGVGYPVLEFRKGGTEDHIWIKVLDGTQTTADPYLLAKFGSHPERPWQSDMVGRGCTIAILTAKVARELLTQLPAARFEPIGLPLYDPRKDSTVGGSGSHRWGQIETYEPTDNPAVIIYNILRGIWYGGGLLYGPAIPATRLPLANWFAAMNECDVPVALDEGGTEPQFRAGYEIKIAEHEPIAVIEEMLKACNGKMVEAGGIYKIHVGAPALPVAFVTDEEFVVTEEQEFEPFPGLENTFNGAAATYPEPDAGWEMKDAPQRLFPAYEAEDDGRQLLADFQFNAVAFPTQVQRLMKSMVEDGRRFRKHRGTLAPWAFVLEPMDTISWTSSREGYADKLFQIASMDDQVNGNQAIAFRETEPSDFDWNASTDELPWSVGPLVPQWPEPQVIVGWQAFPATIGQGANALPSVRIQYPGDLDDVRAIRVQVRMDSDEALIFDGEVPYGDPLTNPNPKSSVLSGSFPPDTAVEVRGKPVAYGARETDWTGWLDVTTPNVWVADIYPVDLDRLADDIRGFQEWAGSGLREIERRLEEYDLWMADQDFGNAYDRQKLRQQITATYDQSKAEWTYEVNVLALANAALAVRTEALEATVNDPATGLAATANAVDGLETSVSEIDGEVTAIANAVTSLSAATTAGIVTEANFRMQAVSGPTGYSRIGLQTRQGGTGSWRGAAAYLDTPNNPAEKTRFAVVADQMVVMDGNGDISAVFDGDTAYFDNARIRNLNADNIDVDALTATSGFFDNVYIDNSLQLGPNVVVTDAVQIGALTDSDNASESNVSFAPSGSPYGSKRLEIEIYSRAGLPILVNLYCNVRGTRTGTTAPFFKSAKATLVMDGNVLWTEEVTSADNADFIFLNRTVFRLIPTVAGNTYTLEYHAHGTVFGGVNPVSTADLVAFCNKA